MFTYNAVVESVHDADTLTVSIDCGFGIWLRKQPLRLAGLNAAEVSTQAGKDARDALRTMLPVGKQIIVKTFKDGKEKYGRYLAEVYVGSESSVNAALIATGLAVAWDGQGARPVPK